MSENTFPFAVQDDAAAQAEEESRSKRSLLVVGGVAAALVVAAGGYFLLGGGDAAEEEAFVPVKRAPAAVAKAAAKPAAKPAVKKVPVAFKDQLGRNPFKALYVQPVAAPAPAAPAAPGAVAPGTGTTGTGTTGTGTTTPGTVTPAAKEYPLKLVSVSKPSPEVRFSTFRVDGTSATVIPGQRFGKHGELVVLAFVQNKSGAVTGVILQVGDDKPIDLSIGETIKVL